MNLFQQVITKKESFIRLFQLLEILLVVFTVIGFIKLLQDPNSNIVFYELGVSLGRTSLLLFILTVIPGIIKRFGFNHPLIVILMLFRRHLGILAFLTAHAHYFLVFFVFNYKPLAAGQLMLAPYVIAGLIAIFLTLPLFLTSNDISMRILGKWWKRIHKLIYIILWFIFLHVVLQRISIWSILIGAAAVLEVASLVYARFRSK